MTTVDDADLEILRAVLAHDVAAVVRTVTSMLGYLDRIDDAQREEIAGMSCRSLAGVERVARQLADLVELVRGLPDGETPLDEVVAEAARDLRLESVAAAPLGTAGGGERVWRIVLGELLDNAWRYGGEAISVSRRGDELLVVDDGPGLDPTDLDRALEAGVRTATAVGCGPGAGLGLFLARRAARSIGGDLRLEAVEPSGTRAVVRLPSGRVAGEG